MGEECVEIVSQMKIKGTLGDEERTRLNTNIRARITEKCEQAKMSVTSALTINEGDDPETVRTKVSLVDEVTAFIERLFNWIAQKIVQYLVEIVRKGVQWCVDKAKAVFDYLRTLFDK